MTKRIGSVMRTQSLRRSRSFGAFDSLDPFGGESLETTLSAATASTFALSGPGRTEPLPAWATGPAARSVRPPALCRRDRGPTDRSAT